MAEVRLDPSEFARIPKYREVIKTLPDEIRLCGKHGDEVTIQERDFSPNPVGVAPFKSAYWVGCCVEAIERVMEAVQKTLELIDHAKRAYLADLAPKLEPDHTGEIVAIELGTNDYFVGENEVEATDKARAAGHQGTLFFLRVGSPYVHRLMTPRQ